jgi:aryl-alcohol dehydrogenase-like predicted oxidoreductase
MKLKQLGNTDIQVSILCLGTMTWGEQNTETEAFEQLDYALDAGINFIDTAELYPVPAIAETYAETEKIIGNWLRQRENRDKVILATKVAGRADWLPYIRDGKTCFDRNNIETALNASLKRLGTDYIDLYQLHWPDRKTNFFGRRGFEFDATDQPVPIIETLQIMADLVKSGKIRHYGLSNETPWGAMSFVKLAEQLDLPKPVSIQNAYNLLNRSYEVGLSEISHHETMGLLAYSPLAFGVLSGKYLHAAQPDGARLTLFKQFDRYNDDIANEATQGYVNIAKKHGLDPAQMALAYINSRSFLTSNIIGATSMEQLRSNIASAEIELGSAVLSEIEAIHQSIPDPCP